MCAVVMENAAFGLLVLSGMFILYILLDGRGHVESRVHQNRN